LNQLDQVQRDVAALLEHGLNRPARPQPTATAVTEDVDASAKPAVAAPLVESATNQA
jgi:hypothetical protein